MKAVLVLLILTAIVVAYALYGRDWLKTKPWAQGFFAFIEPAEILLFKKSPTILVARFKQIAALSLAVLPYIGGFDPTPYVAVIPEQHRWWVMLVPSVALAIDGMVGEKLRNKVRTPIEIVAAPAAVSPETAAVVAAAADANLVAVAVVKAEKAA